MKNLLLFFLIAVLPLACAPKNEGVQEQAVMTEENPAAPGFDLSSDTKAVEIADEVMKAMGGRKNWDNTKYISWNFFGKRDLFWDKSTGNVRIEIPEEELIIVVNEKEDKGKVWKSGQLMENQDSLGKYLDRGERIWINDSYWLVMPFKLKDDGVKLTYLNEDTTAQGELADVLRLSFQNVGVTPENAYNIWVSKSENLIKQWSWYAQASDSIPRFVLPWDNYRSLGLILLSDERGNRDLSKIKVWEALPEGIFEETGYML